VGLTLDGRYRIEARIARGGMATVYRAMDTRLGRDVAIKILHSDLAADDEYRRKFTHEGFSTARLSDPNIVSIFDQGQDGDLIYLVMEYLPGFTLRGLLQAHGPLGAQAALDVFEPIASGLAAAHAAGIIHRDLKPENILITADGRVKIADFGLARPSTANTASSGALLGTVAYLAPELLARANADERSDLYSLGVMLYEMLTGAQPYQGEQAMQIAYQHANSDIPLPSTAVPSIPSGLDDLVVWMTRRNPLDRPANATELLEQTQWVRTELNLPPATARSFLKAVTEDPSESDTRVITPTAVSPQVVQPTRVSQVLPRLSVPPDLQLQTALRRRRRRGVLLTVAALLVIVIAGAIGWFTGDGPGALRVVPAVASLPADQATTRLTDLGFLTKRVIENSVEVASGRVITTEPAAGARRTRGTQITLHVSSGPRTVTVPNVVGSAADTAAAALRQVGLRVANSRPEVFSERIRTGAVTAAALEDGTVLQEGARQPQGTKVTLTVSLGAVPNVVGKTLAQARAALTKVGLKLEEGEEQFSDTVDAGDVISQSNEEDPLSQGGTVQVILSKGPELVTVPDVQGKSVADALTALQNAGLNPSTSAPGYLQQILRATGTNPAAGSQVRKGSSVTVSGTVSFGN
jgi:serine/threonine-protein kinase